MNKSFYSSRGHLFRYAFFAAGFLGAVQLPLAAETTDAALEKAPALESAAAAAKESLPAAAAPARQIPALQSAVPVIVKAPEVIVPGGVPAATQEMQEKVTEALPEAPPLPAVEEKIQAVKAEIPAALEMPAEQSAPELIDAPEVPEKTVAAAAAVVSEPPAEIAAKAPEIMLPGDMEIPTLGPKPGSTFVRTGLYIEGVGLTSSHKPFITQRPKEPVESRSEFSDETSQIFWFAFFQEGRTHEERMRRPQFSVEWFAPDGQLVYSGTFRANIAYPEHVKTRLPLATLGMPVITGRWRVKVMCSDQLVDERHFMVAPLAAQA